jgi:BirA family biotin operon repressor/biotin-[acetyl-CoA-carboxylase] ligase
MGRLWISAEGNLFCSLLLAPHCDSETAAQLSFVSALAVIETLKPIIAEDNELTCKWPNDVLLNGKKVGGILLESFETADITPGQDKMVRWVVVGVGINIDSCPDNTDIPATYLKEAGVEIISAKIVLSRFIHHFITEYDLWAKKGFVPIRKRWMEYAFRVDQPIEVRLPKETHTGIFEGIDTNGHLLLKPRGGKRIAISAGEVFW